jgi:NAD dependent epimerase/dehydratase family enzyme
MKAPAFAIKLFMGEMGGALLSSQKGVPERLETAGFQFQYPELETALSDIV